MRQSRFTYSQIMAILKQSMPRLALMFQTCVASKALATRTSTNGAQCMAALQLQMQKCSLR